MKDPSNMHALEHVDLSIHYSMKDPSNMHALEHVDLYTYFC